MIADGEDDAAADDCNSEYGVVLMTIANSEDSAADDAAAADDC
jgi:hypothetical protein